MTTTKRLSDLVVICLTSNDFGLRMAETDCEIVKYLTGLQRDCHDVCITALSWKLYSICH